MAAATATPEVLELTATSNPYLDFYNGFCRSKHQELFKVFDPAVSERKRRAMYNALDVSVAMKYAWAIPDERALRIIKHYGPIVEMGAGTGYWARLLQLRGVDIVCYDLHVADKEGGGEQDQEQEEEQEEEDEEVEEDEEEEEDIDGEVEESEEESEGNDEGEDSEEEVEVEQIYWTDVLKGTPKKLREHADRTLFLCYPDDFEDSKESMALEALHHYSGEYVIHVGEMFSQTLCLPGAWGRTSSSDFQEHLASVYHKILQVPLPSWHSSMDSLTVWKRTQTSIMNNAFYAFIPESERLDLVAACPSTRHLLAAADENNEEAKSVKRKAEIKQNGKPVATDNDTKSDEATGKKHKNRKRHKKTK